MSANLRRIQALKTDGARRDLTADMLEADRLSKRNARNRSVGMGSLKTKYGRVERPPVTDGDDTALDEWQESIDEALATARAAAEREAVLDSTKTTDTRRFPILDQKGSNS